MKSKIIQIIPVLLALVIIGFAHFSQWCAGTTHSCHWPVIDQMIPYITYPLYFFALYSLPITIVLVCIRRDLFNSWFKFSLLALPLSILYIANTDVTSGGAYFVLFPFYRDDAARLAAEVFTAVSLALIIFKTVLPKIRESYRKKYGPEEAETEIKDFIILLASSVGLISLISLIASVSIFLDMSPTNRFLATISFWTFVLSTPYVLFHVLRSLYVKIKTHTPLRRRIKTSAQLLALSAGILAGIYIYIIKYHHF
jgi:hypothetical protein